jgi:hypothetical protein
VLMMCCQNKLIYLFTTFTHFIVHLSSFIYLPMSLNEEF